MSKNVSLKTLGLDALIKAIQGNMPKIQVGVLGDKNSRSGKANSNATVGAAHEFGAPARKLPQRSFLRMPINLKLNQYLKNAGPFDKESIAEVQRSGSFAKILEKIGVLAETIVSDAFDSNGFGNWEPLSPGYENNTGNTLVDTQQLRNSITSRVVGGSE